MTDIKISKALALAIGYMQHHVRQSKHFNEIEVKRPWNLGDFGSWEAFNYRDARVIWPIAERYNVFPYLIKVSGGDAGKWNVLSGGKDCIADTAAKVVALAVIRMAKAEKKARGK